MNRNLLKITGWTLIFWGVYLNIPFSILAVIFDYPNILREPPAVILAGFRAGGGRLLAAWYAFALAAILFLPVVLLMREVLRKTQHWLLFSATVAGIIAAVLQTVGLIRWTFVVPVLANADAAAKDAAAKETIAVIFQTIHQLVGVALGEHLGQFFTAVWILLISIVMRRSPIFGRWQTTGGVMISVVILLGLIEGFATVLPFDPGIFAFFASIGFVALAVWLITLGVSLLRSKTEAVSVDLR